MTRGYRSKPWPRSRRWHRRGIRRVDWLALLILVGGGLYAAYVSYSDRREPPPAVITGRAFVLDGDTVSIAGRHIRLEGIDAPERSQTCTDAQGERWPCGQVATRQLVTRIQGQTLTCRTRGLDQYDRVLGICSLPDDTDVNAWMVRQGWAVAFGSSGRYDPEQAAAEGEKRGLWAGPFERPSLWRKIRGE